MKRLARIALTAIISFSMTVGSTPAMAFAESAAAANAAVSASAGSPKNGQEASPESDGILVTLDKDASDEISLLSADAGKDIQESKAVQNLEDAGLDVTGKTEDADGTVILTAKSDEGASDAEALAAAKKADGVKTAQFNYVYHLIEPVEESAPLARSQAQDESLDGALNLLPVNDSFTQNSDPSKADNQYWAYNAKLPAAWRWAKTDHKVTVAVMDSGVNMEHEDLKANVLKDYAFNSQSYAVNSAAGSNELDETDVTDNYGHGTHVSGIIAGVANNGAGIAGASYNANILPIKVLNDDTATATSASFIAAYNRLFFLVKEHPELNVRVVNISLGGYNGSGMNDDFLHEAIKDARSIYGILTVCAGGNGKASYDENGNSIRVPLTENIYPGDWDECVSVTALEPDGANVSFSDYNKQKDISAPGADVWSTDTQGFEGTLNTRYNYRTGSSMASPVVAGIAALLYSTGEDVLPADVCEALYETADPVLDSVNDRSESSGSHGAVNAVAALDYVTRGQNEKTFPDVAANNWFYEGVSFTARHEIMNGYNDGTGRFDPNAGLLREQAACVLYNYLGNGEICEATDKVDVDQTDGVYYREAVNWAIAHGIMNGYSDGSNRFGVGEPLTREQVACIFSNMLAKDSDLANMDTTGFEAAPDKGQVSSWAIQGVQWALNKGVISGVLDDDGARRIQPIGTCTRGMMASIMMNAIKGGVL